MDNMRIGNFIKELRNELGLSQGELAEKVYITREAISKWENGKSIPTYDSLLTLASLFNVSIDELLLRKRKNDKINKEEIIKRDIAEIENSAKGGPIAYADYYILNNEDKESYKKHLLEIIKIQNLDLDNLQETL